MRLLRLTERSASHTIGPSEALSQTARPKAAVAMSEQPPVWQCPVLRSPRPPLHIAESVWDGVADVQHSIDEIPGGIEWEQSVSGETDCRWR